MRRITFSEDAAFALRNISLKAARSRTHLMLTSAIHDKLDMIRNRTDRGKRVDGSFWPDDYKHLYKLRLPMYWRMIYTKEDRKAEIVAFILDVYDNKDYRAKGAGQPGSSGLSPP